jgi:hypothetical protein
MSENQQAGNIGPAWSEEQQDEYLRRYKLTNKKERIQHIATQILHGQATHGVTNVRRAFEDAEALVKLVDEIQ